MRYDYRLDDSPANTPFDTVVEALMGVLLIFMPLAYGGVNAWSQEIGYALVAAMGVSLLLKQIVRPEERGVWTWAYLPIAAFLLLTVFQLTPLPTQVAEWLSPATVRLRRELLGDAAAGPQPLSLYAWATAQHARFVLAAAALFVIVLHAYRTPARVRRLLITMTLAGLAVAGLAAYMDATQPATIYGLVKIGHPNSGPFQNYSHFSQFMNLSVGAAIGLLLWTGAEWLAIDRDWRSLIDRAKRPENWFVWPAMTLCLVGPVLVFWSMSRMGMVSMLAAGAITAGLFGWRTGRGGREGGRPGGLFLTLGLGVAVLAVLLAVGFESIYDRLATLRHADTASAISRVQLLKDLSAVWKQFPLLGVGLGTHEFVYPVFSHQRVPALFTHAENEYAQLLEETGGVGLACVLLFAALVLTAYVRSVWKPRRPEHFAAFGLGFGVIAILIHSATDFGQHVPANAALTAVCAALLIHAAASAKASPRVPIHPDGRWALPLRVAVLVLFASGAIWTLYRADSMRQAEAARETSQQLAAGLERTGWQGGDDAFADLIAAANTAAGLEPGNVLYGHWLNAYRWRLINSQVADRPTRQLQFTDESLAFAKELVGHFDSVYALCPTFGPPLSLAGQIRVVVLDDPRGEKDVRQAYRLTPYDRTVSYVAGALAARRQDWDLAREALKRYVELGGPRSQVLDVYSAARRPDLAYEIAAGDRPSLQRMARGLKRSIHYKALGERCGVEANQLLIAASEAADASPSVWVERAAFEEENKRPGQAVIWYTKAVDAEYARVDWRLTLSRLLMSLGRQDEAVRHLRVCLRLRPNLTEAQSLLATAGTSRPDGKAAAR